MQLRPAKVDVILSERSEPKNLRTAMSRKILQLCGLAASLRMTERWTMDREEVLRAVAQADGDFAEEILTAAINRKRQLHPDWEIRYLAQPGQAGLEERERYARAWQVLTGGK